MNALLLSAGIGSRLGALSRELPKCLMPINGVPLIRLWLDFLFKNGVDEVLVNLHYLPRLVEEYLTSLPYQNRVKTVYEKNLLGTAGTLKRHQEFLKHSPSLLIHGDNLSSFAFNEFRQANAFYGNDCALSMMLFQTKEPELCGIVELTDDGRVKAFHEKVENPPGNLANAAVYWINPEIFDALNQIDKDVIDFSTEVIPNFMGRIGSYVNSSYHRDIGNPRSFLSAQKEFLSNSLSLSLSGHFSQLTSESLYNLDYFANGLAVELQGTVVSPDESIRALSGSTGVTALIVKSKYWDESLHHRLIEAKLKGAPASVVYVVETLDIRQLSHRLFQESSVQHLVLRIGGD